MTTLSPEVSAQLAQEMNKNYPVMVYAMAKQVGDIPKGSKLSSYKVTKVSNVECEVSYVTCRGDACSMPKKATYKFKTPLGEKVFLKKLQSEVCAPKFHWLFTKPLAFLIWVTCTLLSIAAMGLGVAGITEKMDKMPRFENAVATIFGSAHAFAVIVLVSWCFAVIAHFIEGITAYRYCERMPFSNSHASSWALLVFLVGWPIFVEIKELFEVKLEHSKKK